jgi:hypothetical protein
MDTTKTILHVAASAEVGAPAREVYRMIADYRTEYLRILPPRYFRNLQVEQGGYGDGTIIRYDVIAFGKTQHARARVTEPEPGRVLVETDLDNGPVTTFIVDSIGASRSRVTFATDMPTRGGVLGWIERAIARSFLHRAYAAELAQLDAEVTGIPVRRESRRAGAV